MTALLTGKKERKKKIIVEKRIPENDYRIIIIKTPSLKQWGT